MRSTTNHHNTGSAPRLRVLCIDDSPEIAHMLTRLIAVQNDMYNLGVLNSAEGIVQKVMQNMADVLVVDLSLPGPPPLRAIQDVTRKFPSCRILAYSGNDDPGTCDQVRAAGACELVSKRGEPDDIIHAIRRVAERPATRMTA